MRRPFKEVPNKTDIGTSARTKKVGGYKLETKRQINFGIEARLFTLIFVVASIISAALAGYVYTREKTSLEQALGNELVRVARVFASVLDPGEVARLPNEPMSSPLVRHYRELAQHV